ncbi:MAG: PDZ domain-containing protein [Gammaproteobacteria bacterium]|nr:MAG: PDZ domain-containing protein [Gammaproteobacteria bacterium]
MRMSGFFPASRTRGLPDAPVATAVFRQRLRLAFMALLVLVGGAGCAPTTEIARPAGSDVLEEQQWQRIEAEKVYLKRKSHLQDLAWRIRTAGLQLCPEDHIRSVGWVWKDTATLDNKDRKLFSGVYGLKEGIVITHVIFGSPAAYAGLRELDVIRSVNGVAIPSANATEAFVRSLEVLSMPSSNQNLSLGIERDEEQLTLEIVPVKTCSFPVVLIKNDDLNAAADGKAIYITAGMYRFAESDEELMTVIAHEFAHNSEGHIEKRTGNYLLGSIFDIIAAGYGVNTQGTFGNLGGSLYSQDFEREADYVGMYYLANAGVDTAVVNEFWRRMAIEHPDGIREHYNSSHPSTAERWANLKATHEEIEQKLVSEAALLPERK